jgi:heparin binding hemagglutinin HbhA
MSEPNAKIPAPIYAAAGAGDLAIERLRKLPERVAGLQERVTTLQGELPGRIGVIQDKVTQKVAELPSFVAELRQRVVDADTEKLRDSARRNANVVLTNAHTAQERASAIYARLVTRGEQVVGRSMPAPQAERVVAEIVTTDTPAAADAEVVDGVIEPEAKPKAAPKKTTKPRKTS